MGNAMSGGVRRGQKMAGEGGAPMGGGIGIRQSASCIASIFAETKFYIVTCAANTQHGGCGTERSFTRLITSARGPT